MGLGAAGVLVDVGAVAAADGVIGNAGVISICGAAALDDVALCEPLGVPDEGRDPDGVLLELA